MPTFLNTFTSAFVRNNKLEEDREITGHVDPFLAEALNDVKTLRREEYARLEGTTYMDWTGAALYPQSLPRKHAELMANAVYGNPHSASPSSTASSKAATAARTSLLNFVGADPNIYDVIWTSNTSTAIQLMGESFPWEVGQVMLLGEDSHNSVNGLRELVAPHGVMTVYYPCAKGGISVQEVEEVYLKPFESRYNSAGLFVLTAQSNVTGFKAPLSLLEKAFSHGFHTFVDAAAFLPTNPIKLSGLASQGGLGNSVDGMAMSMYKCFGYPTGVGALVIKKSLMGRMRKSYFAGGTVKFVSVPGPGYETETGYARFEDGTQNFLSMLAIPLGLDWLRKKQPMLATRLPYLLHYLVFQLEQISYPSIRPDGSQQPLLKILSPRLEEFGGIDGWRKLGRAQGPIVVFQVWDRKGNFLNVGDVERLAGKAGIHLRAGCHCNPGAVFRIFKLTPHEAFDLGGVLRASLGLATDMEDCNKLISFMKSLARSSRLVLKDVQKECH